MKFEIELGAWNQVFAVPAAVVDRHLKLAGSAQLKVLLWLLRRAGEQNDPEEIGAALGLSRADVCDAMQYWIEAGLIRENEGIMKPAEGAAEDAGPVVRAEAAAAAPERTAAPKPAGNTSRRPERPQQLDPGEVAARINSDEELRCMMETVQTILARPVSTPEMGILLNMHDFDGLPADVIVMIVQYAVNMGKNNLSYIQKMSISWASEGVDSHEKAEKKIAELEERHDAWARVCRLFGMDKRSPSAYESDAVLRWTKEWNFSDEMLREAYDCCVNSINKIQFKFINSVLERWMLQGIRTVEEARREAVKFREKDSKRKTAGKPAEEKRETSYDIGEFEKMALNGDLMTQ